MTLYSLIYCLFSERAPWTSPAHLERMVARILADLSGGPTVDAFGLPTLEYTAKTDIEELIREIAPLLAMKEPGYAAGPKKHGMEVLEHASLRKSEALAGDQGSGQGFDDVRDTQLSPV